MTVQWIVGDDCLVDTWKGLGKIEAISGEWAWVHTGIISGICYPYSTVPLSKLRRVSPGIGDKCTVEGGNGCCTIEAIHGTWVWVVWDNPVMPTPQTLRLSDLRIKR